VGRTYASDLAGDDNSHSQDWLWYGKLFGEALMKNLNFLVAAYIAIWLVFCGYLFSVARRMANLKDEIRRLKQNGK
jgi:CcmD family protein